MSNFLDDYSSPPERKLTPSPSTFVPPAISKPPQPSAATKMMEANLRQMNISQPSRLPSSISMPLGMSANPRPPPPVAPPPSFFPNQMSIPPQPSFGTTFPNYASNPPPRSQTTFNLNSMGGNTGTPMGFLQPSNNNTLSQNQFANQNAKNIKVLSKQDIDDFLNFK